MEPRITSTSPSSDAIIPWVSRYRCSWAPVSYSPSTTTGACASARATSPFSILRCLRTLSGPYWISSERDGRRKSSTGASGSTTTSTACTARRSASRSGWARSRTGSCTWRTTPAANTGWACSIKYTTFGPGRSRWSTTTNCDQSTSRPKRIAVMLPPGEGGGLRTGIPHTKSSRGRSSTYRSRPVSLAGPSRRCNTGSVPRGARQIGLPQQSHEIPQLSQPQVRDDPVGILRCRPVQQMVALSRGGHGSPAPTRRRVGGGGNEHVDHVLAPPVHERGDRPAAQVVEPPAEEGKAASGEVIDGGR